MSPGRGSGRKVCHSGVWQMFRVVDPVMIAVGQAPWWGSPMTSRRRQGSGVGWLLAFGAALVVLACSPSGAGVSSKVYVN